MVSIWGLHSRAPILCKTSQQWIELTAYEHSLNVLSFIYLNNKHLV